ncbi:MAG: carboxypeptidase-like regulatory domain-containing protein [Gemmatimonadota bacterium]|nr:carboxypeptidase-like regulatory domain-containing protein [Gemmatimonadota bacterium]
MSYIGLGAVVFASLAAATFPLASEQIWAAENDIAGVVTGPTGPEAGVWVIAETSDLPTKFVKIVVTDDRGRYVIPELPKANYRVWVRGYGLVDSPKKRATPGTTLNHTAIVAPDARAAAEYYPAGYWYSLMRIPDEREFPGTGPEGNGISPNVESQAEWLRRVKSGGCLACHQMGNKATR